MSRTLKFRAWTHQNPPMPWSQKAVAITGEGEQMLPIGGTCTGVWHAFKNAADGGLIIEQYTGLKDKNGKEIYEGDILQNADGETATVVWCEETAEWGIEWSDCEVRDSLSWRMTCVKESDSLNEVIGNIHENRDLLGGEE